MFTEPIEWMLGDCLDDEALEKRTAVVCARSAGKQGATDRRNNVDRIRVRIARHRPTHRPRIKALV